MEKQTVYIDDAIVITGRYKRTDKDFIKVYRLFSERCLEDIGALNGELKLLVYMMGQLQTSPINSEGWMHLETKELVETLKISEKSYFSYLKRLREKGYIEQLRTRSTVWRINPKYCYRGGLMESKKKGIIQTNDRPGITHVI